MRKKTKAVRNMGRFAGWAGLALVPAPAFAHPGHETASSFLSGLLHPLTGFDHLAAMLMVGLWAGMALRRYLWAPPVAFVTFMLAGFAYGLAGGPLPVTELLVLASLVVLGLALLFDVRAPLGLALALVALFAFAHGHAHGAELPNGAVAWRFAAGFALMTASLHLAGLAVARFANRPVARAIGASGAALGALLLVAT
jgi:urease accessory protein